MDKLIITAAICGAEVTKEQNPNVPYTVEEIVREAKSAVDAGAAIVHLHVSTCFNFSWYRLRSGIAELHNNSCIVF